MKKSFLSLLLMVPVIAGAIELNPEDECYHIADYEQLKQFATIVNNGSKTACGVLDADIVANEIEFNPNSGEPTNKDNLDSWTPLKDFNGTFDGNNKTISGLYCVTTSDTTGFIRTTSGSGTVIQNLGIKNSYFKANGYVGVFVGAVYGSLQIKNSFNQSNVLAGTAMGGFVGITKERKSGKGDLSIDASYNIGTVGLGPGYDKQKVGGFVGVAENSSLLITNSFNAASVIGIQNVGGFVGELNTSTATIKNSYNTGSITGNQCVGAFVGLDGWYGNPLTVVNSYYLDDGVGAVKGGSFAGATAMSSEEFSDGTVYKALHDYTETDEESGEVIFDGSVWQNDNGTPTISPNGGSSKPEFKGIKLDTLDGVVTATIEASVTGAPSSVVIPENTEVDYVVLERTFAANKNATLILPFSAKIENAEVYNFGGINQDTEGKWFAVLKKISNSYIEANTAYIIKPSSGSLEFSFGGSKVTLVKNDSVQYETKVGNWRFVGVYDYLKWEEAKIGEGHIYGFSSVADDNISVGQFVRGAYGASVSPTRAFLEFVPTPVASRPGLRKMAAPVELPESIDVVVEDDENTMSIGKLNTVTGEIKSDRWFDMNGRKLDAKPMVNGIYQNNGRQVIVK